MQTNTDSRDEVLLKQGDYWRAVVAIPDEGIPLGRILLLQSIRMAEDRVHTLVLYPHPSTAHKYCEHRFLVQDFLKKFEPVAEDVVTQVRTKELGAIQQKLLELQNEIVETQADPKLLQKQLAGGIKKWEKETGQKVGYTDNLPLIDAESVTLNPQLAQKDVDDMRLAALRRGQEARLTADWIKGKTETISETVNTMTPFFHEKAAAALARTEDIKAYVARIEKSVANLELYVGTGVEVLTIRKGASASDDIKLTIRQSKLYLDEELSAWAEVDDTFDYNNIEEFRENLLKSEGLVNQIFPTERSIICVATTRQHKDYSKLDARSASIADQFNKEVFLLARDGENLYQIASPVETHMKTPRLFPSKKEMEELFQRRDRHYDWDTHTDIKTVEDVTYQDTEYTDRLEKHNDMALHYKRFLTLLAGLDSRLTLFGVFHNAPASLSFVSYEFQSKFIEFLHDDEFNSLQLPGAVHQSFGDYIKEKNKVLTSGSRLMCDWKTLINPKTAPSIAEENDHRYTSYWLRVKLRESTSVRVAYREGKNLFVKAPVASDSYTDHRGDFNAAINISNFKKNYYREGTAYLVLDACKSSELEYFVYNRVDREKFLDYLRTLKAAMVFLRGEEERQAPAKAHLVELLALGQLATGAEAERIVDDTIRAWRSANRGKELPTDQAGAEYRQLLGQMYTLAQGDQTVIRCTELAAQLERQPLRITVSGKSVLRLYIAPSEAEQDNRLFPHAWVRRLSLERRKDGLKSTLEKYVVLPVVSASETVLQEWPEAAEWAGRADLGITFEQKQELFDCAEKFGQGPVPLLLCPSITPEEWDTVFAAWKEVRRRVQQRNNSGKVQNPGFWVPVGVARKASQYEEDGPQGARYLALGTDEPEDWLLHLAPDETRRGRVTAEYASIYADELSARGRIGLRPLNRREITLRTAMPDETTHYFTHPYLLPSKFSYRSVKLPHLSKIASLPERVKKDMRNNLPADQLAYVDPGVIRMFEALPPVEEDTSDATE